MNPLKKQLLAYWQTAHLKIDAMSLRERAMVFLAGAFILIFLINTLFLDPLLLKQQGLSNHIVLQQAKMREQQAAIQALIDAKRDDKISPLRAKVEQLREQIQAQKDYLSSRNDRLVRPEQISGLLEQVLRQQGQLQLLKLETLPLTPLLEEAEITDDKAVTPDQRRNMGGTHNQIFKHGVKITVRGRYLDLLRYLTALEQLPTQMFWGEVVFKVETYPEAVMSLTLFTLSLDKIWLAV